MDLPGSFGEGGVDVASKVRRPLACPSVGGVLLNTPPPSSVEPRVVGTLVASVMEVVTSGCTRWEMVASFKITTLGALTSDGTRQKAATPFWTSAIGAVSSRGTVDVVAETVVASLEMVTSGGTRQKV